MFSKKSSIIALRGVRKAGFVSKNAANKATVLFSKIEKKSDRLLIERIGSSSRNTPIDEYFYTQYPYLFPVHPALPLLHQKSSVTVFVPSLVPRGFYGGIATLLVASAALANKLNYDFRVVQTSGFHKSSSVLKFLHDRGVTIDPSRYTTIDISKRNPHNYAYLPLHPDDIVVVSAWWDAHIASQLPLQKKFVYMLQDYEPIFYNNGDEQQFAESTYFTGNFVPLCNTKLMYEYFKQGDYDYIKKNAAWFEPAVGIAGTKSTNNSGNKTLFLYGRPQVHRNMFFTAIKALDSALQDPAFSKDTWSIFCAGASDIPNIKLKSGHTITNLGKMEIEEYYEFTQSVDIALSPMLAPHPNYPTLELASVGAIVVTTKYKTKTNLDNYSSNILLCEPTIEDMAKKLIDASNVLSGNKKSELDNNIMSNWTKNLEEPLNRVIEKL